MSSHHDTLEYKSRRTWSNFNQTLVVNQHTSMCSQCRCTHVETTWHQWVTSNTDLLFARLLGLEFPHDFTLRFNSVLNLCLIFHGDSSCMYFSCQLVILQLSEKKRWWRRRRSESGSTKEFHLPGYTGFVFYFICLFWQNISHIN